MQFTYVDDVSKPMSLSRIKGAALGWLIQSTKIFDKLSFLTGENRVKRSYPPAKKCSEALSHKNQTTCKSMWNPLCQSQLLLIQGQRVVGVRWNIVTDRLVFDF